MSWLLKVVEGPMKGAEVALQAGMRLRVGSSADCDIVLNDVSLASEAFQLDVSESAVMLIAPDGSQTQLKPLEIHDFGTTAIAIGPDDQPWGELVRPAPESAEEAPAPEAPAVKEEILPSAAEAEEKTKEKESHGGLVALVVVCLLFLLLAALAWFFWPRLQALTGGRSACATPTVRAATTLDELAGQYGLRLEKDGETAVLVGNLKRRTERLAIRALALATDPSCRFRLTDDETLRKASNDLLFAYTDGTLRAVAASNGVVTIVGHAPDAAALERALRTLDSDVKGIERVDASGVMLGGKVAVRHEPARIAFRGEPIPEVSAVAPKPKTPQRDYPIAGILTEPYPCVVMRDGQRVMEGALIGTAVLERIESDRLVLKDGGTEFEWRP